MTKREDKPLGAENLSEVFKALERQIALRGNGPIGLVICGGSALAALGLTPRTTGDADVLGQAEEKGEEVRVFPLPSLPVWLEEAARAVAGDFGLPGSWLNTGPASQLEGGLPPGLSGRLIKTVYGPQLTVYYISRFDQICFKLFASADRSPGDYHVSDLLALKPTAAEMAEAAGWVLTQDAAPEFPGLLKDLLRKIGYAAAAEEI
jgi:hypothetical protein